jgi:hypothetical protein
VRYGTGLALPSAGMKTRVNRNLLAGKTLLELALLTALGLGVALAIRTEPLVVTGPPALEQPSRFAGAP